MISLKDMKIGETVVAELVRNPNPNGKLKKVQHKTAINWYVKQGKPIPKNLLKVVQKEKKLKNTTKKTLPTKIGEKKTVKKPVERTTPPRVPKDAKKKAPYKKSFSTDMKLGEKKTVKKPAGFEAKPAKK